ncbi:MAG: hypothetical protein ABIL01_11285 [Pseudomonadota bacterium]|jgi:hypothetical protein
MSAYKFPLVLALTLAAGPVLAQEATVFPGNNTPAAVRTGHDSSSGPAVDYTRTQSIAPNSQNADPTLHGYSANVTRSDIYSGK